jgi:hypothetical protein
MQQGILVCGLPRRYAPRNDGHSFSPQILYFFVVSAFKQDAADYK